MTPLIGINLRASGYLHQGDRKYMEDEFQVAYQKSPDNLSVEHAFFGIFDGHGGKDAAQFAKDNLMDNIISQRDFWSDDDDNVLNSIREGFLQTHHAMWKVLDQWPRTGSGWPSTSGTTATVAFIRKQKMYIGHVGDSGIVLGYENCQGKWMGQNLTKDHKPESLDESKRIRESGGKVLFKSGVPRVVWNRPKSGHQGPIRRSTPMDEIPFLAVARSLGDLWSYNPKNDEFIVSPEPDVCVINIDVNTHRCIILGTDGLWNALTPNHAVNLAYLVERNNDRHHLGLKLPSGKEYPWINPSKTIVVGALENYHRMQLRADNTSAVTVYLDQAGLSRDALLRKRNRLDSPTNHFFESDLLRRLVDFELIYHTVVPTPLLEDDFDATSPTYSPASCKLSNDTSKHPSYAKPTTPSYKSCNNTNCVKSRSSNLAHISKVNEPSKNTKTSYLQSPVISSTCNDTTLKKSENKKTRLRRWRTVQGNRLRSRDKSDGHSSRILKNVNRDNPIHKRKHHLSASGDNESKDRRCTRALSMSAKSMVTRSQDKSMKSKK